MMDQITPAHNEARNTPAAHARASIALHATAQDVLARSTGIVVPVYLPPSIDSLVAEMLIEDTVSGYCGLVADRSMVCISVDGPGKGAALAKRLSGMIGATTVVAPINRGKLHAVRNGAEVLLSRQDVEYLAIVDQDGDHFPNELVNLVRAALHAREISGSDQLLVLGCRPSRHRPLGFLRGEQEELANRMLLDTLHYHASVTARPLRLGFVTAVSAIPDFHSGYKLFARDTAMRTLLGPPELLGQTADCYYRHAVEAVMVVEAVIDGALLVAVNRSTFNDQPISTFGTYERCRLVADMIVWPCMRVGVPGPFVIQWLANHMAPLLLGTLVPEGRNELARIADLVLAPFEGHERAILFGEGGPLFV